MQFFLGVLSLKIHVGVFGMINKWKYSKPQKSPLISWLPWQQCTRNWSKTTILAVWSFLLLLPWQQRTNLKFAISFQRSFVKQTQPLFLT